ncbi:hydantoinase B/oxoprolinase family protein [Amycolatopsis panacis]|uniref:Hydantoinase B/oxoprolinase family protein n=2 Tax=Amycolatopsis panacis TaxID=2340917 RepID=A0A419I2M1_9PSEU|nr:hydantoinase B/oxoprolinase family protein [Amycolatopsis panacis]
MTTTTGKFDAVLTAVLANRFDSIVREMTDTLLRTGRSAVINSARDFSCAITTGDNRLLSAAEGLSVHIFGAQLQSQAMCDAHPDLAEGDAFLDNNPYIGNSHAADHTVLVPVYFEGQHLFTAVAKAHQADIGNSLPTTYHITAKDVYEEGALIFPTVRVQRDYEEVGDIVRMCKARIRVPEQWYGDFLAQIGAARVGERRLKELCAKYGVDTVKEFVENWLNYSEDLIRSEIRKLPARSLHNTARHDALDPVLPDGVPLDVKIDIRSDEGTIVVDLRDNPDNVDCGLNLTEATTRASVYAGVFNSLPTGIPKNSGAFRAVDVLIRDGAIVGRPTFPHSCAIATTNLTDRIINSIGAAFATLGAPHGVAEGAVGMSVSSAVVSGHDARYGGRPYVNQLISGVGGGPGSADADGWVTWGLPCVGGLMYRDSIEVVESKIPMLYEHLRLVPDTGGAGEHRGALAADVAYGPRFDEMTVIFPGDGQETPPRGVRGGLDGVPSRAYLVAADGTQQPLPSAGNVVVRPGETVRGFETSGGGYGDPFARQADLVARDVREGWVTREAALDVYGVVLVDDGVSVRADDEATRTLRSLPRA